MGNVVSAPHWLLSVAMTSVQQLRRKALWEKNSACVEDVCFEKNYVLYLNELHQNEG